MRSVRTIIFLVLLVADMNLGEERKSGANLANYEGDRSTPIDITLNDTIKKEAILLRNGAGNGEKASLINTGTSVEVILDESETTLFITGEAIGNYLFVYTKTIFYFAKEASGVAGTTFEGAHGAPLEVSVIHYNLKYSSYSESLDKPDGITDVRMRFTADREEDNPEFEPFQKKLEEIRKPGKTSIEMSKHNSWYLKFKPAPYYAYPGSLEMKNCAIVIVNKNLFSISKNQFEAFLKIESNDGSELVTKQKTQNQGGRPIIVAEEDQFITYDEGEDTLPSQQ